MGNSNLPSSEPRISSGDLPINPSVSGPMLCQLISMICSLSNQYSFLEAAGSYVFALFLSRKRMSAYILNPQILT